MTFVFDPETRQMVDMGQGLRLHVILCRDGTQFEIMRGEERVLTFVAYATSRPMTDEEREANPTIRCNKVITWHVNGPDGFVPGDDNPAYNSADDLVVETLTAWQSVNGVGCYIDGKPHGALVDVRLRSAFSRTL